MGNMEKWGEMGGNGGKRGGNGGKWGELWETAKNALWGQYKKCVELVGKGRKIGEKWGNLGQILLPSASPPRRESSPSNAHTE